MHKYHKTPTGGRVAPLIGILNKEVPSMIHNTSYVSGEDVETAVLTMTYGQYNTVTVYFVAPDGVARTETKPDSIETISKGVIGMAVEPISITDPGGVGPSIVSSSGLEVMASASYGSFMAPSGLYILHLTAANASAEFD